MWFCLLTFLVLACLLGSRARVLVERTGRCICGGMGDWFMENCGIAWWLLLSPGGLVSGCFGIVWLYVAVGEHPAASMDGMEYWFSTGTAQYIKVVLAHIFEEHGSIPNHS